MEKERGSEEDSGALTCLVAMGRLHPHTVPLKSGKIKVRPTEFVTRFAMNGKFVYVDQRCAGHARCGNGKPLGQLRLFGEQLRSSAGGFFY